MVAPLVIEGGITFEGGISVGPDATGVTTTFTLNSSDFTFGYPYNTVNGHQYPAPQGTNGVDGFILDLSNVAVDGTFLNYPCFNAYEPYDFTNPIIPNFFNSLVTAGIFSSINEDAIWAVTWGPGSTVPNGYVSMSFEGNYTTPYSCGLLMSPLDTTVTGWNTNPPDNTATQSLAGTYMLPATFTLVQPVINKGGQWC